jgi:hypothetical protein
MSRITKGESAESWNPGILRNPMESWNLRESLGILESEGIFRNPLESAGILGILENPIESWGILWNLGIINLNAFRYILLFLESLLK